MTAVNVNGRRYTVNLPDDTPLLWALRDELVVRGGGQLVGRPTSWPVSSDSGQHGPS